MQHQDFLPLVGSVWEEEVDGNPLYRVVVKLRRLKAVLREFNKLKFHNLSDQLERKQSELSGIQVSILGGDFSAEARVTERRLLNEVTQLQGLKEEFWRWKARVSWLREGDRNTKFFFRYAKERQARNSIAILHDKNGNELLDAESIGNEAVRFF